MDRRLVLKNIFNDTIELCEVCDTLAAATENARENSWLYHGGFTARTRLTGSEVE